MGPGPPSVGASWDNLGVVADHKSVLAKQRKLQFVAVPPGAIALDMSGLDQEALIWAEEQGGRIVKWSIKSRALRAGMRPLPLREGSYLVIDRAVLE